MPLKRLNVIFTFPLYFRIFKLTLPFFLSIGKTIILKSSTTHIFKAFKPMQYKKKMATHSPCYIN